MASHLEAIGIPPDTEFSDVIQAMLGRAAHLGSSPDARLDLYVYQDPSGSRATVTLEDRRVVCFMPSAVPGAQLSVNVGELSRDDCPFERPLLVDVLDAEREMLYPLAVCLDDLALTAPMLPTGGDATLELVALAETLDVFPDEVAYRASGTPMAVESLIPSGLFAPAQVQPPDFQVSARMLMTGVVRAAELRRNALFDHPFAWLGVGSYGAEFVVCAAASDLGGAETPRLPAVGSIVSGQFFLTGRLQPEPALA